MVDGAYDIPDEAIHRLVNDYPNDKAMDSQPEGNEQGIVKRLEAENEYLKERIRELEQARERSDMINLQLTRQLENQQKMLEQHQEPWYRRMFRKRREEDVEAR